MDNFVKAAGYALLAVVAEVVLFGFWKPLSGDAGWGLVIVSLAYAFCVAVVLGVFGYSAGGQKSAARAIGYLVFFFFFTASLTMIALAIFQG